jgi:selenocysteine lyase/cysteine desulfurase
VRVVGTARRKASVVSFVMDGIHPHDIGTIVDREGVAIRTGHHCAQPVMDRYSIPATRARVLSRCTTRWTKSTHSSPRWTRRALSWVDTVGMFSFLTG